MTIQLPSLPAVAEWVDPQLVLTVTFSLGSAQPQIGLPFLCCRTRLSEKMVGKRTLAEQTKDRRKRKKGTHFMAYFRNGWGQASKEPLLSSSTVRERLLDGSSAETMLNNFNRQKREIMSGFINN